MAGEVDEYLDDDKIRFPCENCGKLYDIFMENGHLNNFCYKDCQQCEKRIWREEIHWHVCEKPTTAEERERAERDRRHRNLEQDVLTPERLPPSTGYSKLTQQGGRFGSKRSK